MNIGMSRGSRGQVLILVLGVLALGMFVIAPLLVYLDISFNLNMRYQLKSEAYVTAEAGIERVIGDLYMGTDIRVPTYDHNDSAVNEAPAVHGDFKFQINVSEPSALGVAPIDTEKYLDPGTCLGMRPIDDTLGYWDYDFFMSQGEDIKVNWVYYAAGGDHCNPEYSHTDKVEYAMSAITLLDEDLTPVMDARSGRPVRSVVGPTDIGGNPLGDDAREVVNTLFVQGAYPGPDGERGTADDLVTVEAGPYTLRFDNRGYENTPGNNITYVCCPPFKGGDDDYIFSGSINCSELDCGHFIDDSGALSGLGMSGAVMLAVMNENYDDDGGEIDTETFSCDYVRLNITRWDGNVSTYTFNNSTPAGGPHYSFYGEMTTDQGGAEGSAGNTSYAEGYYDELATREFNGGALGGALDLGAAGYDNISRREGRRFDVPVPSAEENAVLMHVFAINESSADVKWINVSWEGYQHKRAETADNNYNWQADDDQLYLYIANWDPDGDPEGAGNPVMHILDHRAQGGGFVWVKLYQGAYRDYLVNSIAYEDENDNNDYDPLEDRKLAMVTVYLRQSPGPSVWWEEQSMEILSWNIQYYVE